MLMKYLLLSGLAVASVAVIAAEEKVDYEKLLKDYAQAYTAMDEKKMEAVVGKDQVPKLAWKFHEYRKARIRPIMTINNITEEKKFQIPGKPAVSDYVNIVGYVSLKVGDKYESRNAATVFYCKNGKIEMLAENYSGNERDFWSAALAADGVAVIKIQKDQKPTVEMIIPGNLKPTKELEVPNWGSFYARTDGSYLIPVNKKNDQYEFRGNGYLPVPCDAKNVDTFLKQWQAFKAVAPEKEMAFLKNTLTDDVSMPLQQAALSRLFVLGYFKSELATEDVAFWQKFILNDKNDLQMRAWLLSVLAKNNGKNTLDLFNAILENEKFTAMAGSVLFRQDPEGFKKLMMQWLGDDKRRNLAVKNAMMLLKDKAFIDAAMSYFKNSGPGEVALFLPILLAPENPTGNAVIKDIMSKQPDAYKNVFPQVYMVIIRIGNPTWKEEIRLAAKNPDNKGFNGYIKPMAMAYLCRHQDKEGIELTEKYFATLKDKSREQSMFLHSFGMAFQRPTMSSEQFKGFLDSLKSGKAINLMTTPSAVAAPTPAAMATPNPVIIKK